MRFLLCFLAILVPWCAMGDIASTTYTNNALDAVVHKTGNETITGVKTFSGTLLISNDIASNTDSNQVATTKWTNDKIDAARGVIPNGGADSTQTAQIWVE